MKKAAKDDRLCLPGIEQWEVWALGSGDRWVRQKEEAASPAELSNIDFFVFPVAGVTTHPFWAVCEDESLIDDMVSLRLETLSLKPAVSKGKHWEYRVLESQGNRHLVMATILEVGRAVVMPKGDAGGFEVAPNLYPLPRNHLVLWRELGRWVACATRNGRPVYYQVLTVNELDRAAILELRCMLLQLQGQNLTEQLSGIVIWDSSIDPESRGLLGRDLGMAVSVEEHPQPLLPEKPLDLLPQVVAENRDRAARRQRLLLWAALAGVAYLLVAAFFGFQIWRSRDRLETLLADNKALDSQVGWIGPTMSRWDSLEPAIDPQRYPVEVLRRIADEIPDKGLRLTRLDVTPTAITISGEAVNSPLARSFLRQVANKAELEEDFEWADPDVKINQDNSAVFSIRAKHRFSDQGGIM